MKKCLKLFSLAMLTVLFVAALCLPSAAVNQPVTVSAKYQKGALEAGKSFDVTISVKNPENAAALAFAGIEYAFSFNDTLFSADIGSVSVNPAFYAVNGWNRSAVSFSVDGGNVKFASHILFFDKSTGYTDSLTDLFTVTLTAKSNIDELFDVFSVTPVMKLIDTEGNILASEADTVVFTNFSIKDLLPAEDETYLFLEEPTVGDTALTLPAVVIGAAGKTVGEVTASFTDLGADITFAVKSGAQAAGESNKIGTGFTLEMYEFGELKQKAVIVVKGDGTGDGAVDLFDVIDLLTYVVGDTYLEDYERLAYKVSDNDLDANIYDVVGLLKYIAAGSRW